MGRGRDGKRVGIFVISSSLNVDHIGEVTRFSCSHKHFAAVSCDWPTCCRLPSPVSFVFLLVCIYGACITNQERPRDCP